MQKNNLWPHQTDGLQTTDFRLRTTNYELRTGKLLKLNILMRLTNDQRENGGKLPITIVLSKA